MFNKKTIFIIALATMTVLYFQNCSTKMNPLVLSSTGATGSLPIDHPATKSVPLATRKNQVVNRDYVKSLILEIFAGSGGLDPTLENLVETWVTNRGSQYGLGCDTLSSYTGADCLGDSSSSNLAPFIDHNAVRESYHLQLCRQVLSLDTAVAAALQKIRNPLAVPDRNAAIAIYQLFYRGDDPSANTINTLLDLDCSLAQNREPALERWRAMLLLVCESPNWQQF